MTQKIGNNFGLFKDTSFTVIILNREFNVRAERRIIPYFQDLYCWTKVLREEMFDAERGLEKSQNIWGKNKFIFWYCRERTESCTLLQLCARIRSDEKISRKLFTSFPLKVKASTRCLVSRHIVSVRQNSSSKPQNPGSTRYSQVYSECGSDQRTSEIERYVWFRRLWKSICLSETHALGTREVWIKDLSAQAMSIPRCKGDNGEGMKGGHKRRHKKQKIKKVHFSALMDISHIRKYRKSNLKCGNYQAQMKELYTNFQRRSMKQECGQNI